MVRCILDGKMYETCPESVEEEVCYPGLAKATAQAVKIMEDEFDASGRPLVKIIYVDVGGGWEKEDEVGQHINNITSIEREKEMTEGRRGPRLIFLLQDRDYWAWSGGAAVEARRAAKQKMHEMRVFGYQRRPDYKSVYVPPLPEDRVPPYSAGREARETHFHFEPFTRRYFRRYFDPSSPGTRFVFENMGSELKLSFEDCMKFPDPLSKLCAEMIE